MPDTPAPGALWLMLESQNFGFLAAHDPTLAHHGALAEHYFSLEPGDCVAKLRQMAEYLAKMAAAYLGLEATAETSFVDVLRLLRDHRALPPQVADLFHCLRKAGNRATHDPEAVFTHGEALGMLKMGRSLAVWFHTSFGKDADFRPGPFVPPADPREADRAVKEELAQLRTALAEHEDALRAADEVAHRQERLRLELQERLAAVAEEREVYEALAREAEERLVLEKGSFAAALTAASAQAASAPAGTLAALVDAAAKAGEALDLDEADTRRLVDAQLRDAGWEADSQRLTHAAGARPRKGADVAIAEWPTASGPADYVLFCGLQAVAVVEAKRKTVDVPGSVEQARRYSRNILFDGAVAAPGGPWSDHRVPFLFATNGRPYLKQLETKSGIWFHDARRPQNHPRALDGWYTPEGLRKELARDVDAADAALAAAPSGYLPLRDYQLEAVRAVEAAIADGRRRILVAMATGTGKTRTCIGLLYRLVKFGRFRRVLFLVDRSALGEQAVNAFKDVRLEALQSFTDIYDVKQLGDLAPDPDTRVHIATVQGMMQRLLYPREDAAPLPVDLYDCVVVDECHRGYILDREMSDSELELRDERDYLSKYRRVLEHFDAVTVGLTATPALHTTEIFGPPVFEYSYRQAVVEGWLVDHEPPVRIVTRLAEGGIHWAVGEPVKAYDPVSGQLELFRTPDELDFEVDQFNRQVVTESFNRTVCDTLTRWVDPDLPGKTLVFCVNDEHADLVVWLLKESFDRAFGGVDDRAVVKITGRADRPLELIRRFKNERDPRVAVTVDLLTTGVDVPEVSNLVFLRRVRSRILYEQMLGRATRLCPEIGKEAFRVFDAVDLYAILEPVTSMKPVVANPTLTFVRLAELIAEATDDRHRRELHEQLVARLQARKRMLDAHHADEMRHYTAGTAEQLVRTIRGMSPDEAARWLAEHPALVAYLDAARARAERRIISEHPDELLSVTRGWGDYDRPEDYLEGFAAFVRDNLNLIPALTVAVQRPRDLTRDQLRDLRLALEEKGFAERTVTAAWREARSEDIAATIVGFVRTQALGSPLEPYAARVDRALARILSRGPWTDPQRRWLERIAQQLRKETVVDRAALDQGEFRQQGGFARLNKVFDGHLERVLADLNEAVWQDTA